MEIDTVREHLRQADVEHNDQSVLKGDIMRLKQMLEGKMAENEQLKSDMQKTDVFL